MRVGKGVLHSLREMRTQSRHSRARAMRGNKKRKRTNQPARFLDAWWRRVLSHAKGRLRISRERKKRRARRKAGM